MTKTRQTLAYGFGLFVLLCAAPRIASADLFTSENRDVSKGNKLLKEKKYNDALEKYDAAARTLPGQNAVHLDRGLALARLGNDKLDQAMQAFTLAGEGNGSDAVRARALANLANSFCKKEDYAKAVELYKRSLMLVPGNRDVAWNFEFALKKKKEKEEQQKKEEEKQKDEQKKQDEQKQDQQKQDQQKQDEQKKDEQKQDQQKQDQQKQDQQKQQQPQPEQKKPEPKEQKEQPQKPKTKQEIEQLLNSLDSDQDNLMKQKAKQQGVAIPQGTWKDW